MAFPSGDWSLFANGFSLDFFIQDSADGTTVNGTIIEGNQRVGSQIQGTWNDGLSQIQFKRKVIDSQGTETGEVQTYIGFLFDRPVTILGTGFTDATCMAGTFTSSGGFENPDKANAGWGWFAYSRGSP